MSRFSPFRVFGRNLFTASKPARTTAARRHASRRPRLEWLEERQLLTWVATFVNSTGALTVQGVGLSSDTGVLKVDPNSGEILLDGNNSGNFVDTGANLATINKSIQIEANTTINSNFIIDNNAGAFFEAPASFPAATPLFTYTGSSALNPNAGLTIRGVAGVANTFEVDPSVTSNLLTSGKTTGESGTVVLRGPTNPLNQQNILTVTFGPNATVPGSTGITGALTLDGISGGGGDTLYVDDMGATMNPNEPGFPSTLGTASDYTLNGGSIAGPQFPPLATVPPTPPPAPGNLGTINYANIGNLVFNNGLTGDLLTINATATNTAATTFGTTVVNYNQPLAFAVDLVGPLSVTTTSANGTTNTTGGTLDIAGALEGNNDFYVSADTVALAPAGTKPQYNVPFTHLGADLTYTSGSMRLLQLAGNGGNNTFTVQVPPVLVAPYTSETLAGTFVVLGGSLPPVPVLPNSRPIPVLPGTDLLRVLGNAPGPLTTGNDSIKVFDYGGATAGNPNTGTAGNLGLANIQMSNITAAVIYGEGGNDQLTNASTGNKAQGIDPVSALLIGGSGNDTLTGGAGNDMFLGGGGQDTIVSTAVSTPVAPTTTYFFPHQDQFGNIYDQLLNSSAGDTASTLTGVGGNTVVVTGAVDPALSVSGTGDLDLGNLANVGLGGAGGGGVTNKNGGQTLSFPTVPPGNVTAPLYMVTPALTALEQAMGVSQGPFAPNKAALLEFGGSLNLRAQFATYAAFVGRAYNDFLIDRGGNGVFGNPAINQGGTGGGTGGGGGGGGITTSGTEGASLVSQPEIDYWVSQGQQGVSVQSMQAQLLASDELQASLPEPSMWVRFLWQSATGQLPPDSVLTADTNLLSASDTVATRYALALQLLTSPMGQAAEISDIYNNVVPKGGSPSPADMAAIQADLSAGESLVQVAQTLAASNGNYLSYENANNVGAIGFVANLYQSVLHRPASASDLEFWATVRGQGFSTAQIAQIVVSSPEARAFVIQNAYESYLGRPADPAGMNFWQAAMAGGLSDEQLVSLLVASPEYYAKHGATSQSYVSALYHDLLQRPVPPSQQEIDYWVSQLAMSARGEVQARADIAVAIQQSDEFRTSLIDRWYLTYDGRAPSGIELNTALALLQSGASQEYVQAQILAARQAS